MGRNEPGLRERKRAFASRDDDFFHHKDTKSTKVSQSANFESFVPSW
jgi:hypothetical protein